MTEAPLSDPVTASRPRLDTVSILGVYVVLLYGIPSDLRLPALGGAGAPSTIWALGGGLWWAWTQLSRSEAGKDTRINPVKACAVVFFGAVLCAYVAAMVRPLSVTEGSQADIGLLRVAAGLSVLLMTADTIVDLTRLRKIIRLFAWAGAGLASIGLAQFVTGRELVDAISIPGFVSTQGFSSIADRGGYIRPAGTAMSPLEYAMALSAALPVAAMIALYDRRTGLVLRWAPPTLIAAALLLSGSRSAFLGLAIGVVALAPAWSPQIRRRALAAGGVAVVAMSVLVPGMLGTLRYLFTETSDDPSAQSRSGSFALVGEFISHSPWFGRGFGTFLPQYRILDNQYLLLLVEAGIVGLAAFVSIWVSAAVCSFSARRRHVDQLDRQLGQGLGAAALVVGGLPLFFDALSFPIAAGTYFLVTGLCAAYWRVSPVTASADRISPTS